MHLDQISHAAIKMVMQIQDSPVPSTGSLENATQWEATEECALTGPSRMLHRINGRVKSPPQSSFELKKKQLNILISPYAN